MLIGEYSHNIDVKGRLNFPAKLREDLGDRFIITKGLDDCLFVYSLEEWKALEEKIKQLPMSKARSIQRYLFSGACEVEPDKQGRILIPANLREFASLEKDVLVIGASNRAEIWNRTKWKEACDDLSSDTIAQAMDDLGF